MHKQCTPLLDTHVRVSPRAPSTSECQVETGRKGSQCAGSWWWLLTDTIRGMTTQKL